MPYKDPNQKREHNRQWMQSKRASESGTPGGPPPLELRIKSAWDVMALLEEQVNLVRNEEQASTLQRARVIAFIASTMLRALETGNLEARLEALEQILKGRPKTA